MAPSGLSLMSYSTLSHLVNLDISLLWPQCLLYRMAPLCSLRLNSRMAGRSRSSRRHHPRLSTRVRTNPVPLQRHKTAAYLTHSVPFPSTLTPMTRRASTQSRAASIATPSTRRRSRLCQVMACHLCRLLQGPTTATCPLSRAVLSSLRST